MITPSNSEFLKAFRVPSAFLLDGKISHLWVCSKKGESNNWRGEIYKVNSSAIEDPNLNNYFCISRLKPVDGEVRRKKENFACMICLTLDDVGTKAKRPDLKPSWSIETSPGNEQWGYILEKPITDEIEAERLVKALIAKGYCDEGATGPSTRYMRLPVGSNDKKEHLANNNGKPYRHQMKAWNPKLLYSTEDLIDKLGLDLKEVKKTLSKNNDFNALCEERESNSELMQKIIKSENYHNSLLQLSARYISRGLPRNVVIEILQDTMSASSDKSSIRFQERYVSIPRLVDTAIEKFSPEKGLVDKFKLIPVSDFVKEKPVGWAIKHILPAGGLAMIYGPSGSGKSFFALDIAASIARGLPWCKKKVTQGKVAYVAAEGVSGFRSRIKAYYKHNDVEIDDLPIKIIPEAPDLTKDNDKALISSIIDGGGADIVIIDTLAQVSAGANENSAEDMSMVLKRCQNIQKETGALVLLIHHSGKDSSKGERGWSGMRGAMDTVIKLLLKIHVNKRKFQNKKMVMIILRFILALIKLTLEVMKIMSLLQVALLN